MAISSHLRRKIADFDPVRDGLTIKQFCKDHDISRQTYFNIKKRVAERGRIGILPDSTAPKNPKRRFDDSVQRLVIGARSILKEQGRDYGPWSIYYYLLDDLAIEQPPSRSTIAQWLHEAGAVDANARKRPRSAYRRFNRDSVNELWQIDGLVYRLFDKDHTQITVYQVIDDASRFDVGTQAFAAVENGDDARRTLAAAFDTYGLPLEVLSDNGEAFATYHRGRLSATEVWLASKGIWASAGFRPTTQGKDERSHKTLVMYLDARQPTTLQQVQDLLVEYREFYNTKRRHQSLLHGKMHITPHQAWEILPHVDPPTQPIDPDQLWAKIVHGYRSFHGIETDDDLRSVENALEEAATSPRASVNDNESSQQEQLATARPTLPATSGNAWSIPDELWINKSGVVRICGHGIYVGWRFKNRKIYSAVSDDNYAEFFTDHDGELLFAFPLPITLTHRPAGGQVNIGFVEGFWHRRPPRISPELSHPRPSRRKKP